MSDTDMIQRTLVQIEEWVSRRKSMHIPAREDTRDGITFIFKPAGANVCVTWSVVRDGTTCVSAQLRDTRFELVDSTNAEKKRYLRHLLTPISSVLNTGAVANIAPTSVKGGRAGDLISIVCEDLECLEGRIPDTTEPMRRRIGKLLTGTVYMGDRALRRLCMSAYQRNRIMTRAPEVTRRVVMWSVVH